MTKINSFEPYFKGFVADCGGTILPESQERGVKTADYYFEKHNVIAELKTLMEDSTSSMSNMMLETVQEWGGDPKTIPVKVDSNGFPTVDQSDIPAEIRTKWMAKYFSHIELKVENANKQILSTKAQFGLPNARGILLISNASNPYMNNPLAYREALAKIILERTQTGERKYSHIDGAVYFSNELPSRIEQMPFWAPFNVRQSSDEDEASIQTFLAEIRQGWYNYIEKTTGVTVRQHDAE
jgi:hypothetical protein